MALRARRLEGAESGRVRQVDGLTAVDRNLTRVGLEQGLGGTEERRLGALDPDVDRERERRRGQDERHEQERRGSGQKRTSKHVSFLPRGELVRSGRQVF